MGKKVLYIEDDENLATTIAYILEQEGFLPTIATTGGQGVIAFHEIQPQIVLLDIQLPDMSGHAVAQILQQDLIFNECFLVLISGRGTESDIINSLNLYADEYLIKPINPKLLIAKLHSFDRRQMLLKNSAPVEHFPNLTSEITLLPDKMDVIYRGRPLGLTRTEYAIFKLLYQNYNKILKRDFLIDEIRGKGFSITHRIIDFQICQLRKKLQHFSENLETIRGQGYRLKINHTTPTPYV